MKMNIAFATFLLLIFSGCIAAAENLKIGDFTVNTNINNLSFSINDLITDVYKKTDYFAREYPRQSITSGVYSQGILMSEISKRMKSYDMHLPVKSDRVETRQFAFINLYMFSDRIDIILIWNTGYDKQFNIVEDPLLKNPVSTARGIKIGDSKSTVLSAYGQPQNKDEKDSNNLLLMYYLNDPTVFSIRYEIVFEIKDGKVRAIFLCNVYKDEFKRKDTDFSILVNGKKVALEVPLEQLKNLLGEPNRTEFKDSKWDKGDLIHNIYKGMTFICFRGETPIVFQMLVDSPEIKSSRGIQVGDNKNKVISKYGDDFSEGKNYIRYKLNYKGEEFEISDLHTTYFLYFYFNEKNEVKSFSLEKELPGD